MNARNVGESIVTTNTNTKEIVLSEPSSAGYQWLPVKNGKFLVKSKEYEIDEEYVGSPAKVTFTILPLTDEPFEIVFELKRPFEDSIAETQTFKFNE